MDKKTYQINIFEKNKEKKHNVTI